MPASKPSLVLSICSLLVLLGSQSIPVVGQDLSGVVRPSSHRESSDVAVLPLKPMPQSALPPAPSPRGPAMTAKNASTFLLRQVVITGNTRISTEQISEVTQAYVGRLVAVEDLSRMRDEITQLYVSKGYISSGAVLPAQDASNGVIRVQVIEGVLEGIEVEGLESLDKTYVTDRFGADPAGVVNLREYEERFRVLLDDSAIREVHADLRPGKTLGTATLLLKVRESDRFTLQSNFANERSPSVGGDRGSLEALLRNAVFSGDYLKAEVGATEGTWDGSLSYSAPLSADGLQSSTAIDYSHAKAIEEPLTALDVLSESISVNTGLSYPVFVENGSETAQKLVLSTALNFQHSETFLGGVPFPFTPGSVDGTTQYWSGILGGQYTLRSSDTAIAFGADLKVGIHALENDTSNAATPNPNFWLASARTQVAHRLDDSGLQLLFRAEGQYTDGPLFVPDRFSAGGLDSVRGYRKNRALSDFGLTVSAELQRPLFATGLSDKPGDRDVSVFAFLDAAHFWNAGPTPPEVNRLAGIGGGVAWNPTDWASTRLTFAKALNELRAPAEDLQDQGIYFQISLRPTELF